jgi:hypothetical protein
MTSPEEPPGPLKAYVGIIWIDEDPGIRVTIWARSGEEAERKIVEEYGAGHAYTLRNEEDATRIR